MAKYTLKTQKTDESVDEFIASITDKVQRAEARTLCDLMALATKAPPVMWGKSIIGFGTYEYIYASGSSGTWMKTGFAARKGNFTVYIMDGFKPYSELLDKLGPHKTAKSCLYIKSLAEVDTNVLKEIVSQSYKSVKDIKQR